MVLLCDPLSTRRQHKWAGCSNKKGMEVVCNAVFFSLKEARNTLFNNTSFIITKEENLGFWDFFFFFCIKRSQFSFN